LEAAVFTFIFFFLLTLVGGYIIVKYIEWVGTRFV
jgi:hypothetical protein